MVEPIQKLAVVLQCASTGGWRYVMRLLEGLRNQRPELEITCYLGAPVQVTFAADRPGEFLTQLGIRVASWPELPEAPPVGKFRPVRKWRYQKSQSNYQQWLKHLDDYNVVFFAWPYWLQCPETNAKVVFIPHDFNYLHFMGAFNVTPSDAARQKRLHEDWLQRGTPIVSTQFIADELHRGFPDSTVIPRVVPLARLSDQAQLGSDESVNLIRGLGIEGDYLLSVNNTAYHKNIGQILGAFYYVLEKHPELKLVLVGHNTEGASGNLRTPWYVDLGSTPSQVVSLGMRSDREVAALIQQSRLVLNASLYEAGNGSGLDAWALGAPVAMSNIPPFREHLETLGVQAELFHPRCCFSIADAINRVLENQSRAAEMINVSRRAMLQYTWDDVARQYLEVFGL